MKREKSQGSGTTNEIVSNKSAFGPPLGRIGYNYLGQAKIYQISSKSNQKYKFTISPYNQFG